MARANIFENADQHIGGAFTAENCSLKLGTENSTGAIVQRVNFTINRPINFIYELGTKGAPFQNVYYVGGRRQGQAQFERIVGGSNVFKNFVDKYGPLCEKAGDNIELTAHGGCPIVPPAVDGAAPVPAGKAEGVKYTLKTPKITSLGASVSAQDIVIMESVGMVFLDLLYQAADGDGAPAAPGPAAPPRGDL
jgi:hypothetical protein